MNCQRRFINLDSLHEMMVPPQKTGRNVPRFNIENP